MRAYGQLAKHDYMLLHTLKDVENVQIINVLCLLGVNSLVMVTMFLVYSCSIFDRTEAYSSARKYLEQFQHALEFDCTLYMEL